MNQPIPENLELIIRSEREKIGESEQSKFKHMKNIYDRKDDPFSLDFLVNEEDEDHLEYGEEIVEIAEMG